MSAATFNFSYLVDGAESVDDILARKAEDPMHHIAAVLHFAHTEHVNTLVHRGFHPRVVGGILRSMATQIFVDALLAEYEANPQGHPLDTQRLNAMEFGHECVNNARMLLEMGLLDSAKQGQHMPAERTQ